MNGLLPRSMKGLIIAGFSLVALPLVGAVIHAVISVTELANQSEHLVLQSIQVTRQGEQLTEQLVDMERNVRQFQVLGDPALRDLYLEKHQRFWETLNQLEALVNQEATRENLRQLRRNSGAVLTALQNHPLLPEEALSAGQRQTAQEVLAGFEGLKTLARWIATQSFYFIDREQEALQAAAVQARRLLLGEAAALIPVVLILTGLFTHLIARPIRQTGEAIRQLGEGRLEDSISVSGPPELQALGEQLDWLRTRLITLEQEKNSFLRHMSHELKTPLASIREGTELLSDGTLGRLPPRQQEVVEILHNSGGELQRLIENLLSFSAWQARQAGLELSRFSMKTLILQVADAHRLTLLGRDLHLHIRAEDAVIHADREKIRIMLDNLLSNAIKFSPPDGDLWIAAEIHTGTVVIDVADSGPGIHEAERDRIFRPFYQGPTPQSGPVRGTGIGLSVVKECVQAHGGHIEIVDGVHEGAQFRITLPLDPALPQMPRRRHSVTPVVVAPHFLDGG